MGLGTPVFEASAFIHLLFLSVLFGEHTQLCSGLTSGSAQESLCNVRDRTWFSYRQGQSLTLPGPSTFSQRQQLQGT